MSQCKRVLIGNNGGNDSSMIEMEEETPSGSALNVFMLNRITKWRAISARAPEEHGYQRKSWTFSNIMQES